MAEAEASEDHSNLCYSNIVSRTQDIQGDCFTGLPFEEEVEVEVEQINVTLINLAEEDAAQVVVEEE